MTIKELIELLNRFPDEAPVVFSDGAGSQWEIKAAVFNAYDDKVHIMPTHLSYEDLSSQLSLISD